MAAKLEIYKCSECGNVVEMLHAGGGKLICCGQPMQLMVENTVDAAKEKHIPVVEKIEGGVKVTVGSVAHPMTEEHLIQWIELIVNGKSCTKFLNPGDAPEATFKCCCEGDITVRAYCNLHGLWKA